MPGKGKTNTRPWTSEELAAIGQGAEALGLSAEEALAQLGDEAVDVYLNDVAYWRGVPAGVWSYTILRPWLDGMGTARAVECAETRMKVETSVCGIKLTMVSDKYSNFYS
jgi:hypothetical protein